MNLTPVANLAQPALWQRALDEQLKGLKAGEKRSIKVTAPDNFANEQLRGKEVEIEIALKDLKKLEPVEVNQEFLESLGFEKEQELLDALRVGVNRALRAILEAAPKHAPKRRSAKRTT